MHCSFRGDLKYCGDGGLDLQLLWERLSWREIKNCPGRYVSSSKELRSMHPAIILAEYETAYETREFRIPGKDFIIINRFIIGGGGLLTYQKDTTSGGGITFVHTFNTESGLIRKVEAMGLVYVPISITCKGSIDTATHFSVVMHILGFLNHAEKNRAAHYLVVRLRNLPSVA